MRHTVNVAKRVQDYSVTCRNTNGEIEYCKNRNICIYVYVVHTGMYVYMRQRVQSEYGCSFLDLSYAAEL